MRRITVLLVLFLTLFFTFKTFADESMTVSGNIPPKATDFQLDFHSSVGQTVNQDDSITYTITYGSNLYYASQLGIEARWQEGTIKGDTSPSIEVVDYDGASNAYNDTPPVVDLVNKKITWTISSFPKRTTDQTVTFKLKTNDSYQGDKLVIWPTSVKLINPQFTTNSISLSNNYLYNPSIVTPGPTGTGSQTTTPTGSSTSSSSPSPTSAPLPPTLKFSNISYKLVSTSSISLSAITTLASKVQAFYGTNFNSLISSTQQESNFSLQHTLTLDKLSANTIYYVKLKAIDESGNIVYSDILVFTTAAKPPVVQVQKSNAILSSGGNILTTISQLLSNLQFFNVVLPNTTNYEITYTLPPSNSLKSIEVVVQNKHVLGITNAAFASGQDTILVPMTQKQPGVYYAKLPQILLSGVYEISVRIAETTGNIYEQKITDITISLPIQIIDKATEIPVADARIFYYFYNDKTNKFEPITQNFGSIKNPDFSDKNGFVNTTLPQGKYKAEVSALFYDNTSKIFVIDESHPYPKIELKNDPYSFLGTFIYLKNSFNDFTNVLLNRIYNFSTTARYYNLFALFIICATIFITFFLFSLKTHMPLKSLPMHLFHHLSHTLPFQNTIVIGKVMSDGKVPISKAEIYTLDENEKILSHSTSNKKGEFSYKKLPHATHIHVISEGFEEFSTPITSGTNEIIVLMTNPDAVEFVKGTFVQAATSLLGLLFETFLALSLILEFAFAFQFGFVKTLPFIFLSFLNILLWIFYSKEAFFEGMRK